MKASRVSPLSRCSPVHVRSARVGVASRWVAISAGERSFHAALLAFDFGFDSEDSEGGTPSSLTTDADGVRRYEDPPTRPPRLLVAEGVGYRPRVRVRVHG